MQQKLQLMLISVLAAFVMLVSCDRSGDNAHSSVGSITIESTLMIAEGETDLLLVKMSPVNAKTPLYEWSSDHPEIVAVNELGEVKAVGVGDATITVKVKGRPECVATCDVEVVVPVETLSFDWSAYTIGMQSPTIINVSITPDNGHTPTLLWSSSDEGIATVEVVENDGSVGVVDSKVDDADVDVDTDAAPSDKPMYYLKGHSVGTAIITVGVYGQPDISESFEVTVSEQDIIVEDITFNNDELNLTPFITREVKAYIMTENGVKPMMKWKTGDENLATVTPLEVTESGEFGQFIATATVSTLNSDREPVDIILETYDKDGPRQGSCKVYIKREADWYIGDYYPVYDDPDSAVGVVYALDWDKNIGSVVSVDGVELPCSTKPDVIKENGGNIYPSSVTPMIDEYPAFKWCVDKNDGSYPSLNWWLPSTVSLIPIYTNLLTTNRDRTDMIFKRAKNGDILVNGYYTSSTECKGSTSHCMRSIWFKTDGRTYHDMPKVNPYYVRATSSFSMLIEDPEEVKLDQTNLGLKLGDSPVKLIPQLDVVYPKAQYEWSSSDEAVATVDGEGNVSPVTSGVATITVNGYLADGVTLFGTAECKVIVVDPNATETTIIMPDYSTDILSPRMIKEITAVVTTVDGLEPTIEWISSNESVATVIPGTITAEGGSFTITAELVASNTAGTTDVTLKATNGTAVVSKDNTITLERSENWYIGDYYPVFNAPEDAVGVVYMVSDGNPSIVSLHSSPEPLQFATNLNRIRSDGNNTITKSVLLAIDETLETFPAFKWCDDLNDEKYPEIAWWLPATSQIQNMWKNLAINNNAIYESLFEAANGEIIVPEQAYWLNIEPTGASDGDKANSYLLGYGMINGGLYYDYEKVQKTALKALEYPLYARAVATIVAASAVKLDKSNLDLYEIGEEATLTPSLVGYSPSVVYTWSSEDATVATVEDGVVTAVGVGTTTITVTATTSSNSFSTTCSVIVNDESKSISLDITEAELSVGNTQSLVATADNDDTSLIYTWSSDNEDAATVVDGLVTAVGAGDATITATTTTKSGKELTATCAVTVHLAATKVSLDLPEITLNYGAVAENALVPTLDSYDSSIVYTWSSEDETIATVSEGVVTAVGSGTTTITVTATTSVGTFTADCEVTVNAKLDIVTMEDYSTLGTFEPRELQTVKAVIKPTAGTTLTEADVTWSLVQENMATIKSTTFVDNTDGTYTVTATAKMQNTDGDVQIKATYGDYSDVATLKVKRLYKWYIGDYYPTYNDAETAVGVVYYFGLANGKNFMCVMSLVGTEASFATNNDDMSTITAVKSHYGSTFTNIDPTLEKFPAGKFAFFDYTADFDPESKLAAGWWLPEILYIKGFVTNMLLDDSIIGKEDCDAIFEAADGTPVELDKYYWTCNNTPSGIASILVSETGSKQLNKADKTEVLSVRASLKKDYERVLLD